MWSELEKLRAVYYELGLQSAIDYEKFCMISIVYNSSKIEGCSLTESDTRFLIENDITAKGKPLRDHLMVKDHYNAFLFIRDEARKKRKLSTSFICEVNEFVMKNTGGLTKTISGDFDTSKGDIRLAQVFVENKYFPDFKKVPVLLQQMIDEINIKIDTVTGNDILKLSADIHYNLVNIHPFGDGNGRTSRLFMNYIQLYHNEPLVKVFTEDRQNYINSLNKAEEKENPDIFREFICQQQIKFFKAEIKKFNTKDKPFILF